jgi:hypothetical protein
MAGETGGVAGEAGGGSWRGRLAGEGWRGTGGGAWRGRLAGELAGDWRGTGGGEFNAPILLSRRLSSAYFCLFRKLTLLSPSMMSTELSLVDFVP